MSGSCHERSLDELGAAVVGAVRELGQHYKDCAVQLDADTRSLQDQAARRLAVPEPRRTPAPTDVLRLNVGGCTDFATTRRTLTCLLDSRLAELFSGRWDAALPRDADGRIFLDLDPVQFRAILDWLGDACRSGPTAELPDPAAVAPAGAMWGFEALSSLFRFVPCAQDPVTGQDSVCFVDDIAPPDPPTPAALDTGGTVLTPPLGERLLRMVTGDAVQHTFTLLHRASRDGFGADAFHANCNGWSRTVTVAKSVHGVVFGGYAGSAAWGNQNQYVPSEDAFLFCLAGPGVPSPSKHRPRQSQSHNHALFCNAGYGPTFGCGHDLQIASGTGPSATASTNLGNTYSLQSELSHVRLANLVDPPTVAIVDWEVLAVVPKPSLDSLLGAAATVAGQCPQVADVLQKVKSLMVAAFAEDTASRARWKELKSKRDNFERDVSFLRAFLDMDGQAHELIRINVGGKAMTTTRGTLTQFPGSLLASKFGPKWSLQDEETVDGGVFVDASASYFTYVLNFLRLTRLCGEDLDLQPPCMLPASQGTFDRLLDYFGMTEHFPSLHMDTRLMIDSHIIALMAVFGSDAHRLARARLLHRASQDGFTASAFHGNCDGFAHTVTVARSEGGYVFGGYSGASPWGSQNAYVASEGAFVFRLGGPGGATPSAHHLFNNRSSALYCGTGYGPTFGGGHDLCIADGALLPPRTAATMALGNTYNAHSNNCRMALFSLAEGANVTVIEYEVFTLDEMIDTTGQDAYTERVTV
uniref:TLDc domain-containing protein n=1 Tax=Zooxanthella nutricula TaxID=1333877 RepID=A0A7S2HRP4_9DINO